MKLNAVVEIELDMENGETFEQAKNRLYDMMFNGLCKVAPCDFWIQETNEVED